MTVGMKGTDEKHPKSSKLRMLKGPITKDAVFITLQDYSSDSTIHGIQYLGNRKHSTCGRAFWVIIVCIALICTSVQIFNIWYQWIDDPVMTTLSTISLPVEQIDFPAVTLCPQGSTEDIMDNVFYHQFQEWLLRRVADDGAKTRRKRLVEEKTACECHLTDNRNMTDDTLQCCFRLFLDDAFPGIYPNNPKNIATLLNTDDPDRATEIKSVVIGNEEPICDDINRFEFLNNINEWIQRTCPERFQKFNESTCIIGIGEEMSYNDAFTKCKELDGADIFSLDSFKDRKTLNKILGKPINKISKKFEI